MFTTEIIQFLQGLNNPLIYGSMWFISIIGLSPVILCFCLSIAFGLDLKKGLVMINIVAWTAFFSFLLKGQFNYPTPIDVDPSLAIMESSPTGEDLSSMQPANFFQLFSSDLLEVSRNDSIERQGFPSTRTAIQTAFWLSFLLLFKRRWILRLSIIMIILSSVASMYMGLSFLGGVLGGIALGASIAILSFLYISKSRYLIQQTHDSLSLSYFWLPWIAMPFAAFATYWQLASTLGLNMAVIFIVQRRNFPVYHVITWKRILAALLVISSFLATYFINQKVHFSSSSVIDFAIITLLNFLVVLSVLSISRRLFLIKYRLAF